MRLREIILAAAICAPLGAGTAAASDAAATTADTASERTVAPRQRGARRICRDVAPSMTHIPAPRVCMTQREWNRSRDESVDAITQFQGRPDPNASRRTPR